MRLDPNVLNPSQYEVVKLDLEHRQEAVRLERQRLGREFSALAYMALIERNLSAQKRVGEIGRTLDQLRRELAEIEAALEEAAARPERYTPAHDALAELEGRYRGLRADLEAHTGEFRTTRPGEVPFPRCSATSRSPPSSLDCGLSSCGSPEIVADGPTTSARPWSA
jgi:hypothetical protein